MRKIIAITAAAVLLPMPCSALECLETSVQFDYWRHNDHPETFVLVFGQFSNLELVELVEAKETSDGFQAGQQVFLADFTGFKPSRRAFDQPFSTKVTLVFPDESYIGGGSNTSVYADRLPGTVGLVWLQQTDAGYEASASSCTDIVDSNPASVKPALRCLRGGYCPKPY